MEPAVEQREDAGGLALINVIDRASIEPTVERREYTPPQNWELQEALPQ